MERNFQLLLSFINIINQVKHLYWQFPYFGVEDLPLQEIGRGPKTTISSQYIFPGAS